MPASGLAALLLVASPMNGWAQGSPPGGVESSLGFPSEVNAEPVQVRPRWGDAFLSPHDPLVLELSRPLLPGDGRLVLVVGGMDVSGLTRLSTLTLTYLPELAGLPRGEVEVEVYRVEGEDGGWEALGRFPLQVRRAPGVDRVEWDPGMTLGSQGRWAGEQDPDPGPGPRDTYQDWTGNLNLRGALLRGEARMSGEATMVGVSRRDDALRFGELAEEAPRFDLSSYRVGVEPGSRGLRLQLGQGRQGNHPDLLRGHQARGVQAEGRLPGGVEVATALLHGSQRVGWSDLTGVGNPDHRILASQAGIDLLGQRSGRLALEATWVDGSRLPLSSFQRAEVVEAERGRGYGLRMEAATPGNRLQGGLSLARSRHRTPPDPTVEVMVESDARSRFHHALRGNASLVIFQGVALPRGMQASLRGSVRVGRVDPFYRALGTFVRGDLLERVGEMQADLGPLALALTLDRSRDNLDLVPSILTTRTNRRSVRVALPLRRLPSADGSIPERSALLPSVVYQHNQTHQFGANVPVDGGFEPSHIPDQMNDVHNVGLDWSQGRTRAGVRVGHTFQDNRQPGRETMDFRNTTLGASLSLAPGSRTEIGVEGAREVAENVGRERTEVTLRGSLTGRLTLWRDAGLRGSWSPARTQAEGEDLRRTRSSAQLEFTQRIRMDRGLRGPSSGQLFLRFARQSSASLDPALGIDDRRRDWNVASGLSLTLF